VALKYVASKLESFDKQRGNLTPILQMVQDTIAYLPTQAIKIVSEHLEIFECEVYGVATFITSFDFIPPANIRSRFVWVLPAMSGVVTLSLKILNESLTFMPVKPRMTENSALKRSPVWDAVR